MIKVDWCEYVYQTEEAEDTDEPYSWRGTTNTEASDFSARYVEGEGNPYRGMIYPGGFDSDARPGDTVYAVILRYSTGDTFGREDGQTICLDVFSSKELAEGLVQAVRDHEDNGYEFRMHYEGREYYTSWVGHFESLEDVFVETLVVK
jgi:hypothetical protein